MRDEILQTALKQFLKYGIREMSIQKLVAPLGISTKTVYKYFKNKEDLLAEALQLFFSEQFVLFENLESEKKIVALLFDIWYKGIEIQYKVNKLFFHDLNYYYPELQQKTDAINAKRFWNQFIKLVDRGIEEGIFRKEIMSEVALEGIAVLYLSIVREDRFKKYRITPYQIIINTIVPYVRGICTDKGIRELDKYIATLTVD